MMSDQLLSTLRKLRLSGLAESLEIRLHEAATTGLNVRELKLSCRTKAHAFWATGTKAKNRGAKASQGRPARRAPTCTSDDRSAEGWEEAAKVARPDP